jgi:hypothetical protein
MRFTLDFNNDGDKQARAFIVVMVLLAVILAELVLVGTIVAYILVAVDFPAP